MSREAFYFSLSEHPASVAVYSTITLLLAEFTIDVP
jgi:hypothetical protein